MAQVDIDGDIKIVKVMEVEEVISTMKVEDPAKVVREVTGSIYLNLKLSQFLKLSVLHKNLHLQVLPHVLEMCQVMHLAAELQLYKILTRETIIIVVIAEEVELSLLQAPETLQDRIGYKEK